MPTYVVLSNWTDQGIRNVKDSPKRLHATRKAIEAAGGKVLGYYLTMGRYDSVMIVESPSDEAAATLALSSGSAGNVRTETLKAFPEDEYRRIIAKIP
ncbi:GYD domain-containing protein [Chloroflexota bacterium]